MILPTSLNFTEIQRPQTYISRFIESFLQISQISAEMLQNSADANSNVTIFELLVAYSIWFAETMQTGNWLTIRKFVIFCVWINESCLNLGRGTASTGSSQFCRAIPPFSLRSSMIQRGGGCGFRTVNSQCDPKEFSWFHYIPIHFHQKEAKHVEFGKHTHIYP